MAPSPQPLSHQGRGATGREPRTMFAQRVPLFPPHTWYLPTKVGDYHLFCDQYCGTSHAEMVGWIHVLKEEDYEAWLSGARSATGGRATGSLALQGRQLFLKLQCVTCHSANSQAR